MDRTEVNASPVQKRMPGLPPSPSVLLTALLGVLLLLLPQDEKAAATASDTPSAASAAIIMAAPARRSVARMGAGSSSCTPSITATRPAT